MRFRVKDSDTNPEQTVYFELSEDTTHIDMVAITPSGERITVMGIRKRTGEVIVYRGRSDDNTGLVRDSEGRTKVIFI